MTGVQDVCSSDLRGSRPLIDTRLHFHLVGIARLAGFEKDLDLKGYDYNTVLPIFYIGTCSLRSPLTWRNYFMTLSSAIVISAYILFLATTNSTARYIATFLVAAGSFSFGRLTRRRARQPSYPTLQGLPPLAQRSCSET